MTTCSPTTVDEAVQAAILESLTDTLVVSRLTRTRDASGGTKETWTDQPGTVPCWIAPSGGSDLILADRMGLLDTYTILVPWSADILTTDRVKSGGTTFDVSYVPEYDSGRDLKALVAVVAK